MNVLWIVVDTLRAERMGCYGYFRDTSPTIDRLAADGVLFEDFYCSALSTGAAFSCLFSGLPSIAHRFYATPADSPNMMNFDDAIPTLPEIVQCNSSYRTVAVDNLMNFGGHMKQTARGFEFYINPTSDGGFPQPEYTAGEALERFLPWLDCFGREEFFAFVHLWDPHHNPYRAPGYRDRFLQDPNSLDGLPALEAPAGYRYVPQWGRVGEIVWGVSGEQLVRDVDGGTASMLDPGDERAMSQDLYDCSIAYMDSQLAGLLDKLRDLALLDQTIIVLTADHGEGLGIHGTWGHGLLYEDTVHIPLILWRPGLLPQGVRVKGFAQHVDVAPTLLDLMGIAAPGRTLHSRIGTALTVDVRMEGRSLLPQIRGDQPGRRFMVAEVRRGPPDPGYRSFREGAWKLIENLAGERQLYDLEWDPVEKVNLAQSEASRCEDMSLRLQAWVGEHLHGGAQDPMRIW